MTEIIYSLFVRILMVDAPRIPRIKGGGKIFSPEPVNIPSRAVYWPFISKVLIM